MHPEPRRLRESFPPPLPEGPDGHGPADATHIIAALRSAAEQELTIAERLASKARHAFTLGVGVFIVAQTVAFGNFDVIYLTSFERQWIIAIAVGAVFLLGAAGLATLRADSPVSSGDLPLSRLEDDLNATYAGDRDVLGRLGGYYLGVVKSRRNANDRRFAWYRRARLAVVLSLLSTVGELIFALIARSS